MKTMTAVTAVVLMVFYFGIKDYLALPTVEVNPDGKCLRVKVLTEDGKEVKKPCKAIDLKKDKYVLVTVYR